MSPDRGTGPTNPHAVALSKLTAHTARRPFDVAIHGIIAYEQRALAACALAP